MSRSEYTANIQGFSCYANAKPVTMRKAKAQGVNVFKLAGYVLAILAIVAAVF